MFRTELLRCPLDGHELVALEEDPLVGATFADRYVIEACVGEGAMGRVYRARHTRVSRVFALKVLFGDLAADRKMQARFAREADAASRLDHPNLVPVTDFGETREGGLYLVMDFVAGVSLREVIEREGPLAGARVRELARQLASGLAHAHERGLIHRDFKTENVIVTGAGDGEVARIVDFGIAFVQEGSEGASRLTTDGVTLGTPAYMAPEQATRGEIDARTDLFSLGVALYEMLAGVLPFEGAPIEVARKNLSDPVPPIRARAPRAPGCPELEAVAMRLMAKYPADRYASAGALIRVLRGGDDASALGAEPAEGAPAARPLAAPAPAPGEAEGGVDPGEDDFPAERLEPARAEAGPPAAGGTMAVEPPAPGPEGDDAARRGSRGARAGRRRALGAAAALALVLGGGWIAAPYFGDWRRGGEEVAGAGSGTSEAREGAASAEDARRGAVGSAGAGHPDRAGGSLEEGDGDADPAGIRASEDGEGEGGGAGEEGRHGGGDAGRSAREVSESERAAEPPGRGGGDGEPSAAAGELDGAENGDVPAAAVASEEDVSERDEANSEAGEEADRAGEGGAAAQRREVTSDALRFRYRAVGAALDAAGREPGAGELRDRFRELPYTAAMRDGEVRARVYRELRAIESELRALGVEL